MSALSDVIGAVVPLGGGVVVVTCALTLVGWVLRQRYRERLAALNRAKPADVPAIIGDELDKLKISAQRLDSGQQFVLVKEALKQRELRSRRLLVLSLVITLVLAIIAVVGILAPERQQEHSANAPVLGCGEADLALSMEVAGDLIPGRHKPPPGYFASGRLYQFTLANISSVCTIIVKDVELEVLAAVEDQHAAREATTADNQYEVLLHPSAVGKRLKLVPLEGAPRASWNYNYTPKSAPDRFSIQVVPEVRGYSYAIQFVVTWYDPASKRSFTTFSDAYAAFFPSGTGFTLGDDAWSYRREQVADWTAMLQKPVRISVVDNP